jgi:putative molybdopterin biosynthesis protein
MTLPQLMTTREVAELLRIKERKVYELAGANAIPVTRVTGKLLFPRDLVERWLAQHVDYAPAAPSLHRHPDVVCGSHDPLLEWALRESNSDLASIFDGSSAGLDRFARGEAVMAGVHLFDASSGEWNIPAVRAKLPGADVVLVEFARRRQGLITHPDKAAKLHSVSDIGELRFVSRQPGAGARVLFESLCDASKVGIESLCLSETVARTELEVGLAIADGRADVGFAVEAVARQLRLGFVSLVQERFDLVVWRQDYFDPPLQRFLNFCRSEAFVQRAHTFGGYDISCLGKVTYNGA